MDENTLTSPDNATGSGPAVTLDKSTPGSESPDAGSTDSGNTGGESPNVSRDAAGAGTPDGTEGGSAAFSSSVAAAAGSPDGTDGTDETNGTDGTPGDGQRPAGEGAGDVDNDGDGDGARGGTDGEVPTSGHGKLKIALLAAVAVFLIFLAAAPTILLRLALNRDLEPGSGWSRMSASKTRVSPLLTGFRVEGLNFFAEGSETPAFSVESVTGSGLSPLSVLTAVFGRGELLTLISGDGQVTARGASFEGTGAGSSMKGRLDTLYASGLDFGTSGEGAIESTDLKSLRIGGLQISDSYGERARLDSFSLAGLSHGVAGRITAGGIAYADGSGTAMSVEGLSAGGLDMRLASAPGGHPLGFALSLFEALDSLDLDHFSWQAGSQERAYLRSARLDSRVDEAGKPLKKLEMAGVKLGLRALVNTDADPDAAALVAAFGDSPEVELEFSASGAPGGGPRKYELKISIDGSMELGLTQNVARLPSLAAAVSDFPGSALSILGSQIGEGGIWFVDGGAAARLYPVLSERQFRGASAADALKAEVLPVIRGLDPARIVNLLQLEGEAALFLDEPRSLGISWQPAPGFPGSAAVRAGLFAGAGGEGPQGRPEPLQYAVLQEMNVTLSVNGRAPMGVVMAQQP
ncbi:MAG: hypothetical protein LBT40_09730 [Deltaproteobacteria bacterium]|jgi:hypothetical protein|nr:hypothetical protein [Deltaproteobacteria bacterium]